jgi:RNA polymerase sigma-B factor
MHSGHKNEVFSALEDLDCAASEYAIAWTGSDTERRGLLRDDLVRRLIPFADRLASRYRDRAEPLEDLRQVARLGLVKAVDRYNPKRGSFTAFAFVTITGEVKRHFRDHTWGIHVNRRLQNLSMEVVESTADLTQVLGRAPTTAEIARYLKVDENDVHSARMCTIGRRQVSLSTPLRDDGQQELGDLLGGPDANLENIADRLSVEDLMRELPPQVRQLIILRFYGNRTQSQIAAEIGISQMHVSRLLHRGLAWLRAALLNDAPPLWSRLYEYYEPETLKVQLRQTDTSIDVQVDGEIDVHTADRLSRRLRSAVSLAAAHGRITVDLTGAIFTDATGTAVIDDARMSASQSQVALAIVGHPACADPVLAATKHRRPRTTMSDRSPLSS